VINVLTHETRRARKTHVCDYCGQAINAGSVYDYQAGTEDADFYAVKFHPECFTEAASDSIHGELCYQFRAMPRPKSVKVREQ
jgi:hypothetical protein